MDKQENQKINSVFSNMSYNLFDLRSENDRDIFEALKALSTFLPSNSPECQRNLRSVIEARSIADNEQFLEVFKLLDDSLTTVYKSMSEVSDKLNEMRKNLSVTRKNTQKLIDDTMGLQEKIKVIGAMQQISSATIEKFLLTPAELSSLRASTVDMDKFNALAKLKDILYNCKTLMPMGWQVTGQDITEQMTFYQEAGIESLFRWTQGRCRNIERRDPHDLLPRAMATLQERPVLFLQILEEYAIHRRDVLVRLFIDALTETNRGIELRSTEPKRYVGDMLAWLHQAIPCEKDNLNFLLKSCDDTGMAQTMTLLNFHIMDETIQQTLGSISEGICHPLKVRIEHVLFNEDNSKDCILLHSIFYLLRYYRVTFSQILDKSQLNTTFNELVTVAEQTFLHSLQNRIAQLLGMESLNPPQDLLPIQASHKILALLSQLLSMDSSSIEGNKNVVDQMVSYAIDPLLMHITETASKLDSVEMSVYLLNNFHFIQVSLTLYPFLESTLEQLKAQCEAQMDTLTSEQASTFVSHLSLGTIYTILQGRPSKPLSNVPGMEPGSISTFFSQLESLLSTPEFYQLPQLTLLASTNHRIGILKRATSVISSIYSDLYNNVRDPENMYPNPDKLLPLTPETVCQRFNSSF